MVSQAPFCVEILRVDLGSVTCYIRRYSDRLTNFRICMVTRSDYGKPVFDTDGEQIIRTKIGFKIEFIVQNRNLFDGQEKIDNRFVKYPK